jgi:hypothetical protein
MNEKFKTLNNDMVTDISRCLEFVHSETSNVENCFFISKNYWDRLQDIIKQRGFENDADEVSFYRTVKPMFASYIEYFSLLSEGLSFAPPWVEFPETQQGKVEQSAWRNTWQESVNEYWIKEMKRGQRFYRKNQVFLDYCESGDKSNDHEYFLARNNNGAELITRRSHNRDTELFTNHEEILTSWKAYQLYGEYIKKKINKPELT